MDLYTPLDTYQRLLIIHRAAGMYVRTFIKSFRNVTFVLLYDNLIFIEEQRYIK